MASKKQPVKRQVRKKAVVANTVKDVLETIEVSEDTERRMMKLELMRERAEGKLKTVDKKVNADYYNAIQVGIKGIDRQIEYIRKRDK